MSSITCYLMDSSSEIIYDLGRYTKLSSLLLNTLCESRSLPFLHSSWIHPRVSISKLIVTNFISYFNFFLMIINSQHGNIANYSPVVAFDHNFLQNFMCFLKFNIIIGLLNINKYQLSNIFVSYWPNQILRDKMGSIIFLFSLNPLWFSSNTIYT